MIVMKPVAVVGLGAILPDAFDVPAFWNNIVSSRYSISEVPGDRWKPELYYDPDPAVPDKTYSKIGGWVKGFKFDPFRWGIAIPPSVIKHMDEAQQWSIAATRQALVDYGYPGRKLDLSRVAVILGNALGGEMHYVSTLRIRTPEFMEALRVVPQFQALSKEVQSALLEGMKANICAAIPEITEDTMPGELSNIIAGRVANVFNFQGPNFTTDAACASSLAALQAAMEGLNQYHFDAVISGGVDRMMGAEGFVKFSKIGALSPDGSRPYSDGANGFVMGEGAAIFLLKRLEDAEGDGDRIYAVLRGVGSSSDGKGKGITAPNPSGQEQALERAWQNAGLNPATVGLIEGHGTSTRVGDLVEVNSLTKIFGQYDLPNGKIALGSVKSNIGHLKSAAGAAGMLKTVLALNAKVLPPSINYQRPNPNIDFDQIPFYVNTSYRDWEIKPGEVRRAGVSSFGFGGTNFHVVVDEYIPGILAGEKPVFQGVDVAKAAAAIPVEMPIQAATRDDVRPYRGLLFLSANSSVELRKALSEVIERVKNGANAPSGVPSASDLGKNERIAIDYGDKEEFLKRAERALKGFDTEGSSWNALIAHGVFHGVGKVGKVAFLFPGQGSQYVNMLKDLCEVEPIAAQTFAEADRVMEPILGRPLTSFIYVNGDEIALAEAEKALRNTEITQPAMLTANVALLRLMDRFGFEPDMVIGHSLGEYAALVAAGVLTFAEALEVVSARGQEMKKVSWDDNGCMAAVSAPIERVENILQAIDGYVVIANINSPMQSVIGGTTEAVEKALAAFAEAGFQGTKIPVSHAFHTKIVAPASGPLRQVIERMNVQPPNRIIVANVTGEIYPSRRDEIPDILARQVASPVQFIKGMQTLYANGARVFVEIGPKRVLNALATDNLKGKTDVMILATNHPREGAVVSFNKALCGLYAAGVGPTAVPAPASGGSPVSGKVSETEVDETEVKQFVLALVSEKTGYPAEMLDLDLDLEADLGIDTVKQAELFAAVRTHFGIPRRDDLRLSEYTTLEKVIAFVLDSSANLAGNITSTADNAIKTQTPTVQSAGLAVSIPVPALPNYACDERGSNLDSGQVRIRDGRIPLTGSVVISGAGLGLPGKNGRVFDENNIASILNGDVRIEPLSDFTRQSMLMKRVTRLVKSEAGAEMQMIDQLDQTVKLGGQRGTFDLSEEYGVPQDRVNATDISTQLAIAAGIDALHDAGIPLVMSYKLTSKGTYLPDRWKLPEALADETGIIFGSAFPGLDQMAAETANYYQYKTLVEQANELRSILALVPETQIDLHRTLENRIRELDAEADKVDYNFDRRFVFRILPMGHSQFAEHIGAKGPNTHVNAACATTTHAIALAEDWIRAGRARRVVVIAGDDVTSDHLVNWVGTGLMASGAATIEGNPRLAILPFDRRRNGMIMGMGAAALVVESEDAMRERGMRGIAEVVATTIANSAYHGTRLDVSHVTEVMERLVSTAEKRFGILRDEFAARTVFVSHETYTPARGGSAAAEIRALRATFGSKANQVVIANTKGFTGHTMGVGIEDVVAVKALETGKVPPIANIHADFEPDPDLGDLNLSKGGQYNPEYSLRLGAGFGSQIAMTLLRKVPGGFGRVEPGVYHRWLAEIAGYEQAELEVVKHTLRVQHAGAPVKPPRKSNWEYGQSPMLWVDRSESSRTGFMPPEPAVGISPAIPVQPAQAATPVVPIRDSQEPAIVDREAIQTFVVGLVSEKTGYPQEMLDLDLDLEADLGIDTVKQAELFAVVRTQYGIPRREDLRLSEYNTLTKVIGFVIDALGSLESVQKEDRVYPATDIKNDENAAPALIEYPRRVPVLILRPRLELCVPTGITLDENSRIVVVNGHGKAGDALARRLRGRKVQVLSVSSLEIETMERKIAAFAAEGPIQGIYFLPALDIEPAWLDMDTKSFQTELDQRTYALYVLIKAIPGVPFVVSATRMGGLHGYGKAGALSPMGGAVCGLTKAIGLERSGCFVKVVDFEKDAADSDVSTHLIAETVNDPAVVEVGWENGLRYTLSLAEEPVGDENFTLPEGCVFLVSGGSGGIIGPVIVDLARATKGTFFLLSRTVLPDRNDADIAKLKADRNGFKAEMMRRLMDQEERATPAIVEQKIAALERAAQTLATIAAVEEAGGRAVYLPCDIINEQSAAEALDRIAAISGKIDVFIHAAGFERSRKIETKPADEFRQTLQVKAVGFHNLYKLMTVRELTPKVVVMFSSIAGRFGNSGQTDYAAANDTLCKLASHLGKQALTIKTIVLDWGAWAEVGMASRGFVPELMKRAGIEMMQPDSAARLVRREITHGVSGGEVVLAGSLGALLTLVRPDGGLDIEKANAALNTGSPMHSLLTRVTGLSLSQGMVLEADLDPSYEPFLRDHALNGIPILPGVMGVEGLSSAAQLVSSIFASQKSGFQVTRIEDVHFYAAFKFYRGENRKLTWKANVLRTNDGLAAVVELESTVKRYGRDPETIVHFRGRVYLKSSRFPASSKKGTPPYWNGTCTLGADDIYKIYFHGPAFQVLEGVQRRGDQVLGKLRDHQPAITALNHELATAPVLVELCLQTAGVWEVGHTGTLALPSRIGRLQFYQTDAPNSTIFAEVNPRKTDEGGVCFDARVMDTEGRVYLELENYRTEPLPYTVEKDLLKPVLTWLNG